MKYEESVIDTTGTVRVTQLVFHNASWRQLIAVSHCGEHEIACVAGEVEVWPLCKCMPACAWVGVMIKTRQPTGLCRDVVWRGAPGFPPGHQPKTFLFFPLMEFGLSRPMSPSDAGCLDRR